MRLFDPISLRSLALRNRIVVSPMCQYSCSAGEASDWHLIHWGQLLMSGAGMLCIEATAVTEEGRITPFDLGLYDAATERALADRLHRARAQSPACPVAIQLAHAGRKASSRAPWDGGRMIPPDEGGWASVAPSPVPHLAGDSPPHALDDAGLARIRDAFGGAARRARSIGVDAVEVHMAHGYLLHQFLSPVANRRDDRYGGSLSNRMRFPLDVVSAVRDAWPADKPLGVRISATDWIEGGWDLASSVELAKALKSSGCDWIDVSSGGVSTEQKIVAGPGFQVPFAREIRRATGITTIAVGLISDPAQADAIVTGGAADMVAMARAFLWNPRWPWHAAAKLGATVAAPRQYYRAAPRDAAGVFGGSRNEPR